MNNAEQYCLDRVLQGLLELTEDNEVRYFHCRNKRWRIKKGHVYKKRKRYCFYIDGKTHTAYANRIHWILYHRQPIPEGYVVDHKDEDSQNDSIDNLQLMPYAESNGQGQAISQQKIFKELCRWFNFVAKTGRLPETPAEESWVEQGF